jgi:hypothetical protein
VERPYMLDGRGGWNEPSEAPARTVWPVSSLHCARAVRGGCQVSSKSSGGGPQK